MRGGHITKYILVITSLSSCSLDLSNPAKQLAELESAILTKEAFAKTQKEPEEKCPRSQLENEMFRLKKEQYPTYPRLKDIRKYYPGEKFTAIDDTWCHDRIDVCQEFAEQGMCNGTYTELERHTREYINEAKMAEKYGFTMLPPEAPQPLQVMEMAMSCRDTCKYLYKGVAYEDLPEIVKNFGGYEDDIVDNFGLPLPLCSIKEGFIPQAATRALNILSIGYKQQTLVPGLHPKGFEKRKIPKDIYLRILNSRKRLLNAGRKWEIETCDLGMQNCVKPMESDQSQECHLVSAENYHFLNLERGVKEDIFEKLRVLAQDWIGDIVELAGTSVYGIRKYSRGAFLLGHLDHLRTHVISAILNIKQNVDSPWPLQIYDNDGKLHEIILEPGEMVFYESAKLTHGRVKPLNGSAFENVFVHYMPKSQAWFKGSLNQRADKAYPPVTLESIKEADNQLKMKKNELKEELKSMKEHMDSLDFDQKAKLLSQKVTEDIANLDKSIFV